MRITYARHWAIIGLAAVVALPGPILRVLDITGGPHPDFSPIVQSLIFGLGILAAATLLIWASEVAETEVSATLALVTLALVAVLPEYAVDLFFAWTAPNVPECIRLDFPLDCAGGVSDIVHPRNLAIANMTGANRLLVGLAWPMIDPLPPRPPMVSTPNPRRVAATLVAVLALTALVALTACGGGGDGEEEVAATTPGETPTQAPTVEQPTATPGGPTPTAAASPTAATTLPQIGSFCDLVTPDEADEALGEFVTAFPCGTLNGQWQTD